MFITKKHLSRRTLLKGLGGVSLALPFLDSMVSAQTPIAKTAAAPGMPRFMGIFRRTLVSHLLGGQSIFGASGNGRV